jgi:hypothetical protein
VTVAETGAGTATIYGTSQIQYNGPSSENVSFASGATGELVLLDSAAFSGTITGFTGVSSAISDKLDLQDINFSSNQFANSYANGVLTVTDGTHTANITLVGSYTLADFSFGPDGHGGTLVTDPPVGLDQSTTANTGADAPNTTAISAAAVVELTAPPTNTVIFNTDDVTVIHNTDGTTTLSGLHIADADLAASAEAFSQSIAGSASEAPEVTQTLPSLAAMNANLGARPDRGCDGHLLQVSRLRLPLRG